MVNASQTEVDWTNVLLILKPEWFLCFMCDLLLNSRPFPKQERRAECLKALSEVVLEPGIKYYSWCCLRVMVCVVCDD